MESEDSMDFTFYLPEMDYYSILGIRRDASLDEIRASYFELSRSLHPDKQLHLQEEATAQYTIINRAYKILSNPVLRVAYDDYGEAGLSAIENNSQLASAVGAHLKTSEEMRELIQKILRKRNEEELMAKFPSDGEVSLELDAKDLMNNPVEGIKSLLTLDSSMVSMERMLVRQKTEIELSPTTDIHIGGYLINRQGLGDGGVSLNLFHRIPQDFISMRLGANFGQSLSLSGHIQQQISQDNQVMINSEIDGDGFDLEVGVTQKLGKQSQGVLKWGPKKGLTTEYFHARGKSHGSAACYIRPTGFGIVSSLSHSFSASTQGKLMVGLGRNAQSTLASASIGRKLSDNTRVSTGMKLCVRGVIMKFGLHRGNTKFVVPVLLCPVSTESTALSFLAMVVLPIITSHLATGIRKRLKDGHERPDLQQQAMERMEYLREARKTVLIQQRLMEDVAIAKMKEEDRKGYDGLVILVARYGKNPSTETTSGDYVDGISSENGSSDPHLQAINVDVTIPLQFFVKDSKLILHSGSKRQLLGFYDPCFGQYDTRNHGSQTNLSPQLYIRYSFGGAVFEATFSDKQKVCLPSKNSWKMGASEIIR